MKKKAAKKETRGRKPKQHDPINASFDEVLGAIGTSRYQDKRALQGKNKKHD